MGENLVLSVWIVAHDMFTNVLKSFGLAASGASGIVGMTTAAISALGLATVGIGAASVKAATEYQTQFARIQGLTGSTQEQLDYYNKTLIQTSASYDMTATDAAKALYFIISAGLDPLGSAMERAKYNMDTLKYSSMAATASLADQATVADTMTSMMKAFGDSNITAADAANTLTRIETYGKATLSAFAASLGFTMTTAKAAGVSMHETAAAVANLTQVSGQHGARRIQMELDNLMRSLLDINSIGKRAKAEGLNFDAASFSTMTFIGKLQYLQHLTGALSSSINDQTYAQMVNMDATKNQLAATAKLDLELDKSNSNFMKLTGGAAAFIPATILLAQHGSTYNAILTQMESKQDLVTAAFNNMRNTLGQTAKMLEMRLQSILIVIGQQLLPMLTDLGKWFTGLALNVLDFVQSSAGIETVKQFVLGLAVAIGSILIPVIVNAVIAAAPFTLTVLAVAAGCLLLGKAIQAATDHFGGMSNILKMLQPILSFIGDAFHQLQTDMQKALADPQTQQGIADLKKAFIEILPGIKMMAELVGVVLLVALKLALFIIDQWIQHLPGFIALIGKVAEIFGAISTHVVGFVTGMRDKVVGLFQDQSNKATDIAAIQRDKMGIIAAEQKDALIRQALDQHMRLLNEAIKQRNDILAQLQATKDGAARITLEQKLVVTNQHIAMQKSAVVATMAMHHQTVSQIQKLKDDMQKHVEDLRTNIGNAFQRMGVAVLGMIHRIAALTPREIGHMVGESIGHVVLWGVETVVAVQRMVVQVSIIIGQWIRDLPANLLMMSVRAVNALGQMKDRATAQILLMAIQGGEAMLRLAKDAPGIIWQFIQGLITGLVDGAGKVKDAIGNFAGGIVSGFKDALGIHSPSTITMAIGMNLSQGLINGFKSIDIASAWLQHTAALTNPLSAPAYAGAGVMAGTQGQGTAERGIRFANTGGGGGVHNHTWNLTFPSIKSADEIHKAITKTQQDTYLKTRRGGSYGGFNKDS